MITLFLNVISGFIFTKKLLFMQMFVFGIMALEQFVDRLIEWPQYCNHILQISHLRATHSELVAFIERALARISLAHSESEVGHSPAADQFHGPITSSPMNAEVSYSSGLIIILHLKKFL